MQKNKNIQISSKFSKWLFIRLKYGDRRFRTMGTALTLLASSFAIIFGSFHITFASNSGEAIQLPETSKNIDSKVREILKFSTSPSELRRNFFVNSWGKEKSEYKISSWRDFNVLRNSPSESIGFKMLTKKDGDSQLTLPLRFHQGRRYIAQLWLRSPESSNARVGFRSDVPNFEYFAIKSIKLEEGWQLYSISGRFPHETDIDGSLRISLSNPGDEVRVGPIDIQEVEDDEFSPIKVGAKLDTDFLGFVVNRLGAHENWPQANPGFIRLWDTQTAWRDVERTKGNFDLARIEQYISYSAAHGTELLLTLGQSPDWLNYNGALNCTYGIGCDPSFEISDWNTYLKIIHLYFFGRIKYWEIWNEPDYGGFWAGNAAQLVNLVKSARNLVDAHRGGPLIIGPAVTSDGGLDFLDQFLSLGGGSNLDGISFHAYYKLGVENFASYLYNIQNVVNDHGLSMLPLWNTEGAPVCNPDSRKELSPEDLYRERISSTFKAILIMLAKGISRFSYYNYEIQCENAKLIDGLDANILTPAGEALVEASKLLNGYVVIDAFKFEGVSVIRLEKSGGELTILWAQSEKRVQLPSSWRGDVVEEWHSTAFRNRGDGKISVNRLPILLH